MKKRKYTINEHFFDDINNEEKAYWLGFIFADGYITKRKNGQNIFAIKLSEIEPLQKISTAINSNKPIGVYISKSGYNKNKKYFQLSIISDHIVNTLEKLGCVQNKSLILKFPVINSILIPHFIRGYFDGDGSVFYHTQKIKNKIYKYKGIHICGTYEFLNSIKIELHNNKILNTHEKCLYKEKRKKTNCWGLKLLSNKRTNKFLNYIYSNSSICMERKYKYFE